MATHWRTLSTALALALATLLPFPGQAAPTTNQAAIIAALINPQKLATLGSRGADTRVRKCVYWLATARQTKQHPANLLNRVISLGGYWSLSL